MNRDAQALAVADLLAHAHGVPRLYQRLAGRADVLAQGDRHPGGGRHGGKGGGGAQVLMSVRVDAAEKR